MFLFLQAYIFYNYVLHLIITLAIIEMLIRIYVSFLDLMGGVLLMSLN